MSSISLLLSSLIVIIVDVGLINMAMISIPGVIAFIVILMGGSTIFSVLVVIISGSRRQ